MKLGLVLGGVAKGATDTWQTMQDEDRRNTEEADAHKAALSAQSMQSQLDTILNPHAEGDVIGSASGDSVPLSTWASNRNIDPEQFNGMTAAQINKHPVFQQLQAGAPKTTDWSTTQPAPAQAGALPSSAQG